MNPSNQIADGDRSDRAAAGVKASMSHLPNGTPAKPFYGEGMDLGNTTPTHGFQGTAPLGGATPPNVVNPMQRPGNGASPIIRKARP